MTERIIQGQIVNENIEHKWFNSVVTSYVGTLADIHQHIPTFGRCGFGLTQAGNAQTRLNERLDTIVRLPFGEDKTAVPIGIVSKEYTLIPHIAVLAAARKAIEAANIAPKDVSAELDITEYGERMALSLYLPEKYNFKPGDGHPMALRLECLNSVDGSTRFQVLMGWYRFVCSNGLIIGVTSSKLRRRHTGDLRIEDIGTVLSMGINKSGVEKRNFGEWRKKEITLNQLIPWVEKDLREEWGLKAATRAFHIARCGSDVDLTGSFKDCSPTTIAVKETKRVPGAPDRCQNLFDVSQILAWLAQDRRDLQEQLEWREQIPGLMESLN